MVMIHSLQRDENDRGLEVGDKPAMTPFWKPDIILIYSLWRAPLTYHHYHHHHNRHHAGGAHEIQPSNEASVP